MYIYNQPHPLFWAHNRALTVVLNAIKAETVLFTFPALPRSDHEMVVQLYLAQGNNVDVYSQ